MRIIHVNTLNSKVIYRNNVDYLMGVDVENYVKVKNS